MNSGGWLLLSVLFSLLLLVIQRSERKRRFASAIFMGIVGIVIWRYAMYRMDNVCSPNFLAVCQPGLGLTIYPTSAGMAITTINVAILTAVIFNGLFWVIFGRSNPVGSSDSIVVIGMQD